MPDTRMTEALVEPSAAGQGRGRGHRRGGRAATAGRAAVLGGPADEAGVRAARSPAAATATSGDELPLLVVAVLVGELRDAGVVGGRPLPDVEHLAAVPVTEAQVRAVGGEHLELLVVAAGDRPLPELGSVGRAPVPQVDRLAAVPRDDPPPAGAGRLEAELLAGRRARRVLERASSRRRSSRPGSRAPCRCGGTRAGTRRPARSWPPDACWMANSDSGGHHHGSGADLIVGIRHRRRGCCWA